MRYRNPEIRRALAAEYALGTLAGRSRRRFEQALDADPALQREVARWEAWLAHLQLPTSPVRPRPQVWTDIARGIGAVPVLGAVAESRAAANDSRFWRAWASIATAAVLVLAMALVLRTPWHLTAPNPPGDYVALLQMPNSTMHWTLSIAPRRGRMSVAADGQPPALDGKSLELWWISASGPVAVGLLPTSGTGTMLLPPDVDIRGDQVKLAISVEPSGGSPTGQPTGPVVVVANAVKAA